MTATQANATPPQSLRYLGIFAIVFFVYMQMQRAIYRSGITVDYAFFHHFDSILNSIIVPLLFLITGIIFFQFCQNNNRKQLLYKVIDLSIYPYIVWTLIQGVFQTQFDFLTDSNLTMLHVISNLLTEPLGHFSYLYAVFYISLIGIFLLNKPSQKRLALLFSISLALYLSKNQLSSIFILNIISPYFIFFITGIAIQQLSNCLSPTISKQIGWLSIGLLIAVQGVFHGYYHLESYTTNLATLGLTLTSLFCLFFIAKLIDTTRHASVILLSNAAFFIFLSHVLLGSGMRVVLQDIFAINNFSTHLILDCGSAIIGGLIAYGLLSRWSICWLWQPPNSAKCEIIINKTGAVFKSYPIIKYLAGCFTFLGIGALLVIYGLSETSIHRTFKLPEKRHNITLSADPAIIENGKRWAQIYGCYLGCHGKNMEGGTVIDKPFIGKIIAPNLTQAFTTYSINELDNIVREGLRPNGSAVMGSMPISGYHYMSDEQLSAIFSFIATMPKQDTPSKPSTLGWLARIDIISGKYVTRFEEIQTLTPKNSQPSKGERLARAACSECHSITLGGSDIAPSLQVAKAYSFDDFKKLQQTGIGLGNRNLGLMSIMARHRFSNFTDDELYDIYQFLTTEL